MFLIAGFSSTKQSKPNEQKSRCRCISKNERRLLAHCCSTACLRREKSTWPSCDPQEEERSGSHRVCGVLYNRRWLGYSQRFGCNERIVLIDHLSRFSRWTIEFLQLRDITIGKKANQFSFITLHVSF
jgi:hypothetical protein